MNVKVMTAMRKAMPGALILMMSISAGARAESCSIPGQTGDPPTIRLAVTDREPTYYHNRTKRKLSSELVGGMRRETFQSGVTMYRTALGMEASLQLYPLSSGRTCVGVREVVVTWAMTQLDVYIAQEYAPSSCAYGVVKAHEDQHVSRTRSLFQAYSPRLESRLRQAVSRLTPFSTTWPQARVREYLTSQIRDVLQPEVSQFAADAKRANEALDTPQNYAATQALCPQW